MGVGETASIDERGRITIPSEIRKTVGKKEFNIRLINKDTIILEAVNNPDKLAKINEIKLKGDENKANQNFSHVKDRYGGKKHEDT
jgi:bifunctional DNA-binding transcriptional regulator/antitoxin component of YhaV-PrlF toxin-antitoxin module